MSDWSGKYIIGLTGNIATGKSVVREMLEQLGAYGIDADRLAHRIVAQGAPGYKSVVGAFGEGILTHNGDIDRYKLGKIVFSDPKALARLESIVHPLVGNAVDMLIKRSIKSIVVVEAIKLLESNLSAMCDTIWVTYSPQEIQLDRLTKDRGMDKGAARRRIAAQPPQEHKIGAAQVVIRNDGSVEELSKLVLEAWHGIPRSARESLVSTHPAGEKHWIVQRAQREEAEEMAKLIAQLGGGKQDFTSENIIGNFGEKAYLLLKENDQLVGLVGWRVENLVTRIDEVYLATHLQVGKAMRVLIGEIERASNQLLCEVSLLFLPEKFVRYADIWHSLGYRKSTIPELGVRAWQEAAVESRPAGTVMFIKRLRSDRVLRPV